MNYRELTRRLNVELDLSLEFPDSLEGLTGDFATQASWISESYVDIQNSRSWRWLRRVWRIDLIPGQARYTLDSIYDEEEYLDDYEPAYEAAYDAAIAGGSSEDAAVSAGIVAGRAAGAVEANRIKRFQDWVIEDRDNPVNLRIEQQRTTNIFMTFLPWRDYRYTQHARLPVTSPTYWTVDPQDRIIFSGPPAEADPPRFALGEFNQGPQVLENDEDIPEMPSQHHMLIVYKAMERYGYQQADGDVIEESKKKVRELTRNLERTQLPRIGFGAPLA